MEDNKKSYFGGIREGIKSLVTGLRVTLREYFTPKVTEQYPENRKTTFSLCLLAGVNNIHNDPGQQVLKFRLAYVVIEKFS